MANDIADVGGRTDTTPTETTFDRSALESKLESQMSALDGDSNDVLDGEVVGDESEVLDTDVDTDEEDDSQAGQEDEESEDEDEDVEDDTDSEDEEIVEEEAADEPVKKTGKAPTLPSAHRRSLLAGGWTDEEIDTNLEVVGPQFLKVAAIQHDKRNADTARMAELGRRAVAAAEQEQQVQTGVQLQGVPEPLKAYDMAALKEKYGDEELLDDIIGPVNATIQAVNMLLPHLQQGAQVVAQNQQDATNARVHRFFDTKDMDPYRKFYGGTTEAERTPEQFEHRRDVLERASFILKGAEVLQQELSLEQALLEAHDATSSTFREQAVRKAIKRQVKKRNRGISQRPSKRGSKKISSDSGPSATPAEREAKIGRLMRQTFK